MTESFYEHDGIFVHINQHEKECRMQQKRADTFFKVKYWDIRLQKERRGNEDYKIIREAIVTKLDEILIDAGLFYDFVLCGATLDTATVIDALLNSIRKEGIECMKLT
ncbi:hypothetical protein ECANGB1_602 [Enterospora canceri]|uniref:Uncharacterized protein n=1 Tax=Enterospora canceri TaxID=1081671 RepID=A0A1Y1S7U4_9MICR|nr:hypothetical protein ECANGB1_602 [Enterospora canceri]